MEEKGKGQSFFEKIPLRLSENQETSTTTRFFINYHSFLS